MLRTLLITITLLASTALVLAQSPVKRKSEVAFAPSLENRTADRDHYTLRYPFGWELNEPESSSQGMDLILLAPLLDEEEDFRENINIIIQDVQGMGVDLDAYTELSVSQIEGMMEGVTFLYSERREDDRGESYQAIGFTGRMMELDFRFDQRYYIRDEMVYLMTFTSEESTYADYSEAAEKIFDSFRLTDH